MVICGDFNADELNLSEMKLAHYKVKWRDIAEGTFKSQREPILYGTIQHYLN